MNKILVTGGLGFIGSNFILEQIKINKSKILNFDKITYAANPNNLISLSNSNNYNFFKGDIKNSKAISLAINNFKPDIIVNFAAESHVDRSIDGPKGFIETNIVGTYELLQSALSYYNGMSEKQKNNFKFIHISTDEVYGSLLNEGYFTEKSAYNPSSPYSASKASSDHLVKSWYLTYGLPVIVTNCSNNYGPYQFPEKLIPFMILSCLKNKELPVYGDGKNIRDWIYVLDHCSAIDVIMNNGKIGETYNIGSNEEKNNLEVVESICRILNKKIPASNNKNYKDLIHFVEDRPGHDFRYAVDNTKIKKELNWEPQITFDKALELTVDWYIKNQNWWKKILNNDYQLDRIGV
tara:strand:+ start:1717 stop:2769 length:1053 start_codon:yes stop_codon:yes gene_type:complete